MMLYLASQMFLYLIIASILGTLIGWWLSRLNTTQVDDEPILGEEDIYALKYRLDKCFDENATLRSQLKNAEKNHAEQPKSEIFKPISTETNSDALKEKMDVLMDDLQLRDDTISALEKELERVKLNKTQNP